ncbi:hypothetical protein EVAR_99000_1 [Eumeta japonica]|uniref:Uncharacterized protein n=1 Tax=Eumeta variegata TaxID=151549 RepID=A0A4C1XZS0_EUMVA|nr:hypothetical protein EVAR_99000_1 [Eumeta japonica]
MRRCGDAVPASSDRAFYAIPPCFRRAGPCGTDAVRRTNSSLMSTVFLRKSDSRDAERNWVRNRSRNRVLDRIRIENSAGTKTRGREIDNKVVQYKRLKERLCLVHVERKRAEN